MVIRALDTLAGAGRDGQPYQLYKNEIKDVEEYIAIDLIKHGMAIQSSFDEIQDIKNGRPIAIAPMVTRGSIVDAIIKRGRKPKRDV